MFIIDCIKNWIEYRRRKNILKDTKKAKDIFLNYRSDYMCLCFMYVNDRKYGTSIKIRKRIPEFNREFLKAKNNYDKDVWWFSADRESRIKAFDKLIEVYSRR